MDVLVARLADDQKSVAFQDTIVRGVHVAVVDIENATRLTFVKNPAKLAPITNVFQQLPPPVLPGEGLAETGLFLAFGAGCCGDAGHG